MLTMSGEKVQLPIPTIYFSSFRGDGVNDCLVIENLCSDSHFQVTELFSPWGREYFSLILQVDKGTTKLAYMRAALSSLASIHGITFSFMKSIGGREALLEQFHTIKEHHLPRNKVVRNMLEEAMLPFLMYMTRVQPDIAQQLMVNISVAQTTTLVNY